METTVPSQQGMTPAEQRADLWRSIVAGIDAGLNPPRDLGSVESVGGGLYAILHVLTRDDVMPWARYFGGPVSSDYYLRQPIDEPYVMVHSEGGQQSVMASGFLPDGGSIQVVHIEDQPEVDAEDAR